MDVANKIQLSVKLQFEIENALKIALILIGNDIPFSFESFFFFLMFQNRKFKSPVKCHQNASSMFDIVQCFLHDKNLKLIFFFFFLLFFHNKETQLKRKSQR